MSQQITVVRIYMLEGKNHVDDVLKILHDQEKVPGVTVIRGIEGYGDSGEIHTASLLTLSLELPLIIEFFDVPERAEHVIRRLTEELELKHIVSWRAHSHLHDSQPNI
jgi:uncharacterized protein